jgi:hypothetical protein
LWSNRSLSLFSIQLSVKSFVTLLSIVESLPVLRFSRKLLTEQSPGFIVNVYFPDTDSKDELFLYRTLNPSWLIRAIILIRIPVQIFVTLGPRLTKQINAGRTNFDIRLACRKRYICSQSADYRNR